MKNEDGGAGRTAGIPVWETHVREVVPYTPGLQPLPDKRLLKLNTNECPYPPSPGVREVLQRFDADSLRLYPSPDATPLTRALAAHFALEEENIFVGVGSDDVLAMAFLTFFAGSGAEKRSIRFPDITYSFYDVWAGLFGIPYEKKPLREDFTIDPADYRDTKGGVVIANPNAPTGIAMPLSSIEEIIRANPDCVVIVDEAYVDFGAESALPLMKRFENLLVVQTFSKSRALAGLRIGFAAGSARLIRHLKETKFAYNSYTMNRITIEAGVAALRDEAYFKETCARIAATRGRMEEALSALGFSFPQSSANFLFVRHKSASARALYEKLLQNHIYVRYFDAPRTSDYLRITVGTDEEADRLTDFLKGCPEVTC